MTSMKSPFLVAATLLFSLSLFFFFSWVYFETLVCRRTVLEGSLSSLTSFQPLCLFVPKGSRVWEV